MQNKKNAFCKIKLHCQANFNSEMNFICKKLIGLVPQKQNPGITDESHPQFQYYRSQG